MELTTVEPLPGARACTRIGRRSRNEDAYELAADVGLYVVADGLGAYPGGDIASRTAVRSLASHFRRRRLGGVLALDSEALVDELREGIRRAHDDVQAARAGARERMATTVAALTLRHGVGAVAHVGDSRVYRFRRGALTRLTEDHTALQEYGSTHDDADITLTRAVGSRRDSRPTVVSVQVRTHDRYLLCTDGLTHGISDHEIRELLGSHSDANQACQRLVRAALEAGSTDNVTVVIVDC